MEYRSTSNPRSRNPFKSLINKQEIQELKKTINYLEDYLVQLSEERDATSEKLRSSTSLTEDLQQKIKQEQRSNLLLKEEIAQLHQEISALNVSIFKQQEQNSRISQDQLAVTQSLKQEIQRLNFNIQMAYEETTEHRRSLLKLSKKIKILFKSLQVPKSCLKETLDPNLGLAKTKDFILKIPKIYKENSRLQEENQQLFSKLDKFESSQDVSEFKSLVKDSKGLSFFKNKAFCGKQSCAAYPLKTSNWIPKPIHAALEDFKSTNDPITTNAVLSLFSKVNYIWQDREKKRLQRLKKEMLNNTNSSDVTLRKPRMEKTFKTREKVTKEYKVASENIVNIISNYLQADSSQIEDAGNWLVESLLKALAEYTDRILVVI